MLPSRICVRELRGRECYIDYKSMGKQPRTFWNAYISGMLARRLRLSYSNRRILGSLKTRSYRRCVCKRRAESLGGAPTRMTEATYGVWFPVPKKSAARGYTILSPKSFESLKRRKSAYMGSNASTTSKSLTVLRTRPNLRTSAAKRSVSGEGKTFVQKCSPLPKLILWR